MAERQVRSGQLIAPFGPGSIYIDRRGTPLVVAGLDHWFHKYDETKGMVPCSNPAEFYIFEPRLSDLLGVDSFRSPPDFRKPRRNQTPPPNAMLSLPAVRFPRWYRNTKTGRLKRFNLSTATISRPVDGGRWQPVRFISVCSAGHLCEFPWKAWIGCTCPGDGNLVLIDRGGSELSSIRVKCESCPHGSAGSAGKSLAGTTTRPESTQATDGTSGPQPSSAFQKANICCPGDRPWLGERASDSGCKEALVGALINQTNLYFARTISSILIPTAVAKESGMGKLRHEIEEDPSKVCVAKTLWSLGDREASLVLVRDSLNRRGVQYDAGLLEKLLSDLFEGAATYTVADAAQSTNDSELLSFRRAEFNVLRNKLESDEICPDLRIIPTAVQSALSPWISRVNLVERLRETRVFYGFDRLEQNRSPLDNMPEKALTQLFRVPPTERVARWLPATKVYGEGIYIELQEERIAHWQNQQAEWLNKRIDDAFILRLAAVSQTLPPLSGPTREWASRYLLIHTLSHILINQLVFECGYSTAALRERLYVSADQDAPMAAFLIYTAAGDSEGTLGGLVRLGRPERLGDVIARGLSRASWCSADPVCSENLGGTGSRLVNLAACHACSLLPETSCETINQGLDRAVVVGTPDSPENRQRGFLSELVESLSSEICAL